MLPTDAQSYVENMDKAPEGMDAEEQPKPVPEGQKYVCHNLMDVLHFYDDVLYPTYDKIAGLSTDAKEPYNKLVPGNISILQILSLQVVLIIVLRVQKMGELMMHYAGFNLIGFYFMKPDMVIKHVN